MLSKELNQLTAHELQLKIKNLKTATSILSSVLLILFSSTIYLMASSGDITPIMAVPIALMPLVVMNYKKIKMMQNELNKRTA